jgi:hypothetical protein
MKNLLSAVEALQSKVDEADFLRKAQDAFDNTEAAAGGLIGLQDHFKRDSSVKRELERDVEELDRIAKFITKIAGVN